MSCGSIYILKSFHPPAARASETFRLRQITSTLVFRAVGGDAAEARYFVQ